MIRMFPLAVFMLVACLMLGVIGVRRGRRIAGLGGQRAKQHGRRRETLHG